eukprot:2805566-Amphidinium_carterae.1
MIGDSLDVHQSNMDQMIQIRKVNQMSEQTYGESQINTCSPDRVVRGNSLTFRQLAGQHAGAQEGAGTIYDGSKRAHKKRPCHTDTAIPESFPALFQEQICNERLKQFCNYDNKLYKEMDA